MTPTLWELGDHVATPHGDGTIVGFGWVDTSFEGPSLRTALVRLDRTGEVVIPYVKDLKEARRAA